MLFTAPMYNEIYPYLVQDNIEQNKKDIEGIVKKYDVQYWDFSNENYNKELFYNVDHLNSKGAQKFSKQLNEKLLTSSSD